MKKTKHAYKRFQQRGFSGFTLDLIMRYGKCIQAPGGATKIFFGNREWHRQNQGLGSLAGGLFLFV